MSLPQTRTPLTVTQMYALARTAGFTKAEAVNFAAIGMAESRGQWWATSSNPDGGTNIGPWQIDSTNFPKLSAEQLQNPLVNIKAARTLYRSSGYGPWATWPGAAAQFLPQARAGTVPDDQAGGIWNDIKRIFGDIHNVITGGIGTGSGGGGGILQFPVQITSFFDRAERPLQALMWLANPTSWARIIAGALGFLLLGAGLFTLMKAA